MVEFTGVLYAGLMITAQGPKVIEFNVRFGDPETQATLPRLESDLLDLLEAAIDGNLGGMEAKWSTRKAVTVVGVSGGYPGKYETEKVISGLGALDGISDVIHFHAGTKVMNGQIITNGGRVLNVTGLGDTFADAIDSTYRGIKHVTWDGMQYRNDIAACVREK